MPGSFDVTPDDLNRLEPTPAVDLFRKLLLAESHMMGIQTRDVEVPLGIYVADGGIDAEVRGAATQLGSGLIIVPEPNFYQIKTGEFQLQQPSKIEEILFDIRVREENGKKISEKVLKPRVKNCLDLGGVLHIVLFGWDQPNDRDETIQERFQTALSDKGCSYPQARIEICRASKIIGYLARFPSLQLEAKRIGGSVVRTWSAWTDDEDMRSDFQADTAREEQIRTITTALRSVSTGAIHIRLLGDAGIGKTRLALEATRAEDLAPLVMYAPNPEDLERDGLFADVLRSDSQAEVIFVVDECDGNSSKKLWNRLKNKGRRIKLISIDNTPEEVGGGVALVELTDLAQDQIKAILNSYGVLPDELQRWADLCGGSPRVAHVIGINLRDFPGGDNLLLEPSYMVVWERFIAGTDDPHSQVVQRRTLVLRHLALFSRVGHLGEFQDEINWVASKVNKHDQSITKELFFETVTLLQRRKVLQGASSLYINPKALHIKLWADWWEHYGTYFDLETFASDIPPSLLEGFYDHFKFAATSEVARGVVRRLLATDGYFERDDRLRTELGGRFFLALAEADPTSALACLERTLGRWDQQQLKNATGSRRSLVWALEKIAIWKDSFRGAAQLLLELGEAENETWSNNASGVFASLFSLGHGPAAPTQASPVERFPILEAALASASQERRQLGLRGINSALAMETTRLLGAERQGLCPVPQLWTPNSQQELFDAYLQAWAILDRSLDQFDGEDKEKALEIALQQGRRMVYYAPLEAAVLSTVERLATDPDRATWTAMVYFVDDLLFHHKQLTQTAITRLEQLRVGLEGKGFAARLRRWVAVRNFSDEVEMFGSNGGRTRTALTHLAGEALEDLPSLELELAWLNSGEAVNGMQFGSELGTVDTDFRLWPIFLAALERQGDAGNAFFLAGYLKVMRQRDAERWESELDTLINNPSLRQYALELAWRTEVTDKHLRRLLELARRGDLAPAQIGVLALGSPLAHITEDTFASLIQYLLDVGEDFAFLAVSLWHTYYVHANQNPEHTMPHELAWRLLMTALESKSMTNRTMDDFRWNRVAQAFLRQYPVAAVSLAEAMIGKLGQDGTILGLYHAQSLETLNQIMRTHPVELWIFASSFLAGQDVHAYQVRRWLRGEVGGRGSSTPNNIVFVPPEHLWAWVDHDVENRASHLAGLVAPALNPDGEFSLAHELLVRYGERDDVRSNLAANFQSESWMGDLSQHYAAKLQGLRGILAIETNLHVRRWLEDFMGDLQRTIDWSKAREERGL